MVDRGPDGADVQEVSWSQLTQGVEYIRSATTGIMTLSEPSDVTVLAAARAQ